MTQNEALRLALEALEKLFGIESDVAVWRLGGSYRAQQAITAIKAALEAKDEPEQMAKLGWQVIDCPICGGGARAFPKQEAKDEPVAWYLQGLNQRGVSLKKETQEWKPLYTTPPQRTWVGLTDEEMQSIAFESADALSAVFVAEAKLKDKNT